MPGECPLRLAQQKGSGCSERSGRGPLAMLPPGTESGQA
jgi:hypothetical protein